MLLVLLSVQSDFLRVNMEYPKFHINAKYECTKAKTVVKSVGVDDSMEYWSLQVLLSGIIKERVSWCVRALSLRGLEGRSYCHPHRHGVSTPLHFILLVSRL